MRSAKLVVFATALLGGMVGFGPTALAVTCDAAPPAPVDCSHCDTSCIGECRIWLWYSEKTCCTIQAQTWNCCVACWSFPGCSDHVQAIGVCSFSCYCCAQYC